MDEKFSELEPEVGQPVLSTLSDQVRESFDKIVETDKWLTQHNFLVNAGGAAAVLGYIGTSPSSTYAVFPLLIFLIGVVASGIEIRGLLSIYGHLHEDALRRRGGFVSDQINVKEAATIKDVPKWSKRANHWSGVVAQLSFVLGCIVGISGHVCSMLSHVTPSG